MSQLDHFPVIRLRAIPITGPDAVAFMQSQLTMDVGGINDERLYPTAWCSPDGRTDAVMLIAVHGETVTLVLPEALVAATIRRARMFSIGRNVVLEKDFPVRPATSASLGRALPLALDSERSILIDASESDRESGNNDMLSAEWLRADIESEMPWILPETAGTYLPQMLGLETMGGLSYRKGCFPGQEVIARVHYRGRVTRRIAKFRLAAESPPPPGLEFELAGKKAQVLYAVGEPGVTGLAVVSVEAGDAADIVIDSASGTLL